MSSSTQKHFNNIAHTYKNEIPLHIRDHLISRLWNICLPYFFHGCKVIDIGCGDRTNVDFFKAKGIDIIGVDFSKSQTKLTVSAGKIGFQRDTYQKPFKIFG